MIARDASQPRCSIALSGNRSREEIAEQPTLLGQMSSRAERLVTLVNLVAHHSSEAAMDQTGHAAKRLPPPSLAGLPSPIQVTVALGYRGHARASTFQQDHLTTVETHPAVSGKPVGFRVAISPLIGRSITRRRDQAVAADLTGSCK